MLKTRCFIGRDLLILLCILSFCACSKGPKLSPLPTDAVILAFGDSLTYGTGATPQESYPSVLGTLINRTVVNAGIPGETTEEGRRRLAGVLDEVRPTLMLLCLGGNDFLRRLDEAQARDNLRTMIAMAKERGIDVLLIAVPKLGFGLQVPVIYSELAKSEQIPLEEGILADILSSDKLKSDTIHPNAAGYKLMAEAIDKRLRQAGAL